MGYPKTYEVTGPVPVMDTLTGGKFTLDGPVYWKHNPEVLAIREDLLVQGGLIRLVKEAGESCGICQEHGTKKDKEAEYTRKQLAEHHEKAHPGYEPPREG